MTEVAIVADVADLADVTDVAIVANVAGKADVIVVTDVEQSHCAYTYFGGNVLCNVVFFLQHQVFLKNKHKTNVAPCVFYFPKIRISAAALFHNCHIYNICYICHICHI